MVFTQPLNPLKRARVARFERDDALKRRQLRGWIRLDPTEPEPGRCVRGIARDDVTKGRVGALTLASARRRDRLVKKLVGIDGHRACSVVVPDQLLRARS